MKYEKLLAYKLFKHIAIETIRDCEQYLKATNDFLTFENIDYLLITEDINNSVSDYNIIRYGITKLEDNFNKLIFELKNILIPIYQFNQRIKMIENQYYFNNF